MSTDASNQPKVSVIIGFKDWGLERLRLSIRSIHASLDGIDHEIIISDYGSKDSASIAEAAEQVNARHVVVETEGEWSRSRALNAGVSASRGTLILATDADMLFSPTALGRVVSQLENHPAELVILQCRDLPTGYSHDVVSRETIDWDKFASMAQIRPRWGMGGLVGVRREIWDRLRGWDERMHTYGGEDIDFGKRAQMLGARIDWLDEPGVAMYHIWHPSSGSSASRSPEAVAAIAENRRIHTEDKTFARNRVQPRYLPATIPPLVTVIFDGTYEGKAEPTLNTIIGQSVHDIEILTIGARPTGANDPRVKCVSPDEISPDGTFITVARPGEIWADDYLEQLLDAWTPGVGLTSTAGSELLTDEAGDALAALRVLESDAPNPRSTLARATLLPRSAGFTGRAWVETIRSIAASGADWVVRPEALHITVATLDTEESLKNERIIDSTLLKGTLSRCGIPSPQVPDGQVRGLGIRANSALYRRRITLRVHAAGGVNIAEATPLIDNSTSWETSSILTRAGEVLRREYAWTGNDLGFALRSKRAFLQIGASVTMCYAEDDLAADFTDDLPARLARSGEEVYGDTNQRSIWYATQVDDEQFASTQKRLMSTPSVTVVLDRIVEIDGVQTLWLLARHRDVSIRGAIAIASTLVQSGPLSVLELPANSSRLETSE